MPRAPIPLTPLDALLREVRACRLCEAHLPLGPRPVLQAGAGARVLVIGQAPGAKVHASGVPWQDRSGERLRDWLGVDEATFYDAQRIALIPMGLCYPGKGASGDLPPRPECAPQWLQRLRAELPAVQLTLLVGQYAQRHLLGAAMGGSVSAAVRDWRRFGPALLPLPHPSPRNITWFQANPWFEQTLLPELRRRVHTVLGGA